MKPAKPVDIDEYAVWLHKTHGVQVSERTRAYYDAVVNKICTDFARTTLWQTLGNEFEQINREYYVQTSYYLFGENAMPSLLTKPFDSFLLKTFRHNVINNNNWPEAPASGWVLPGNWFERINDVVRTYFVAKYLDGVNFLAAELQKRCAAAGYQCRLDYEAKEEGYYAAHFYVAFPCEVPREDWDTRDLVVFIEIQITTQLQEVIRRLLHKYYERRRAESPMPSVKWQWNYRSDEFAANYLGHILHYVEGMIMEVRDRRIGKEAENEG